MKNVFEVMGDYKAQFGHEFNIRNLPNDKDNDEAAKRKLELAIVNNTPLDEAAFYTEFGIEPTPEGAIE